MVDFIFFLSVSVRLTGTVSLIHVNLFLSNLFFSYIVLDVNLLHFLVLPVPYSFSLTLND